MTEDPSQDRLTRHLRRRGQALLIRTAAGSSVANALVDQLGALFLLGLGAAPLHVGLLAAATHLDRVGRLGGLRLMPRLGKTGVLVWGRIGSLFPSAALVGLALSGMGGLRAVWLGLVLFGVRGVLRQAGNTAWWPLVQDNTAGDALGAFLARMRLRQRALELVVPLGIGWYLGTQPSAQRFALPFALGVIAIGAAGWFARGVSGRPVPVPTAGVWRRLAQALGQASIRRLSFFFMLQSCLAALALPFWVVMLTDRGMAAVFFVWMASVMALGNMSGLSLWGRLVDRHGSRPTLTIALLAKAALGLAWLGLPSGPVWLVGWATVVYLIQGLLAGGQQMAQNRAMVDAVPAQWQAEGFTLLMYGAGLGGAVGGVLGGLAFQWAHRLAWSSTWGEPGLVYLAGAHLMLVGAWYASRFLTGFDEQMSTRRLVRQWIGRARFGG